MANQSESKGTNPLSILNRNFLSPIGFQLSFKRMPGVSFFCQSANVPKMKINSVSTPTRFNKIQQPGDEIIYDPMSVRFLIDENMKNYYQVHDWMRQIATPVSSKEFTYSRGSIKSQNRKESDINTDSVWADQWRTDASLFVLSSNYQPVAEFIFHDCFPRKLTTIQFDATVTDILYFMGEMSLQYSYFDYHIMHAANATDETMKPDNLISEEGVNLTR
tara:strand:- start:1678 stop:2334 length:657 start_codon:yes stop_codon:yes gene_type:complete